MKMQPVARVLEDHAKRVAHARGTEVRPALVTGRRAFGPTGASYDLSVNGFAVSDIAAPDNDYSSGDEVVMARFGDAGGMTIVQQMADTTRRPTQSAQFGALDVTGRNTL